MANDRRISFPRIDYLAPGAGEPLAFALLLGGAVFRVVELPFGVAYFVRHFLHRFIAERAAEHFARLHP